MNRISTPLSDGASLRPDPIDTGGSGRIPAGFNGIIGIKPTVGLVSSRGLVPNCPTLDCPSIFCNSIAEGRILLGLIEGFDDTDPFSRQRIASSIPSPRKFRFGQVFVGHLNSFAIQECVRAMAASRPRLRPSLHRIGPATDRRRADRKSRFGPIGPNPTPRALRADRADRHRIFSDLPVHTSCTRRLPTVLEDLISRSSPS